MKQLLIAFALSFCISTVSEAATYYVATTGSDSNPGTLSQPFRTIKKGISALATAGDTLYIRSGTYGETINTNTIPIPSGTSWSNPVTISAYNGETVTLNPSGGAGVINLPSTSGLSPSLQYLIVNGLILDGSNLTATGPVGISVSHIRFTNVEVKNAPGGRMGIQVPPGGNFNEFINCNVHDNGKLIESTGLTGYGIYIEGANNLVDRCDIYNNGGYGVHIYSSGSTTTSNNIVRNSLLHNNSVSGLTSAGIILSSGSGNEAYNNIIYGNLGGIQVNSSSVNGKVYNNTLYANTYWGIYLYPNSSGTIVKNNIAYQNAGSNIINSGTASTLSNNLTTNPNFVNPSAADFHLQSGSLAIDSGVDLSSVGITTDFAGSARPQGCCYDIGAYEYAAVATSSFTAPSVTPGVTVDSTYAGYTTAPIDDGIINASGGTATTWASSDSSTDHWVNIAFSSSQSINTATIYWAYNTYQQKYMTSQTVYVQYWNGSAYQTIATISYPGSNVSSSSLSFPAVNTNQLRFYQPSNQGNPTYSTIFWITEINYGLLTPPSAPGVLAVSAP